MLGAAEGFPVTLCMPANVSPERKKMLNAYGAEVVWTDPADGSDGAIRQARALAAAEPEKYFYADQYGNDENWLAHYRGTAHNHRKSGSRQRGRSPTLWPDWAPAARSWAPRGALRS